MKTAKVELIRYIPESIAANEIIKIIQGYGMDNDTIDTEPNNTSSIAWHIEIKCVRCDNINQKGE